LAAFGEIRASKIALKYHRKDTPYQAKLEFEIGKESLNRSKMWLQARDGESLKYDLGLLGIKFSSKR